MAMTGLRRDSEALPVLKTAMEISPDYVPAIEAAVEIEYRQGKPEVVSHLKHLLALRPGESTAHAMLGALAWKQSDCAAAVQHFESGQAGHRRPAGCAPRVRSLSREDEAAGRRGRGFPGVARPATR